MYWFALVAAVEDPISGVTVWGAIAYSMLLSAVLGWVFGKLIPDKDKQINDLIKDKDTLHRELMAARDLEMKEMRNDCRASQERVLAVCDKGHAETVIMIREAMGLIREVQEDVRQARGRRS